MSSKGPGHIELETSEVEKLRIEVHQMTGESQAVLLYTIRSMLVEVNRDNGRSESGSAESSAAVRESPEGAGPTAVGQSPAGASSCCSCRGWSREGPARSTRGGWRDGCIP